MPLIIDRDYQNGTGELFTAESKEPSMGRKGWKRDHLTLVQVQAFIAHYFGPETENDKVNCPRCNEP